MDLKALAFLDIYNFVHTPDLYSAGGEIWISVLRGQEDSARKK